MFEFLAGAVGRLLLGKVLDFVAKWQDNRNELARLRLQGELDEAQHKRQQDAIRLQNELQIKVIEVQAEAHVTAAEADAFLEAVKSTRVQTGIKIIDAWNGAIRPLLATVCIALWIQSLWERRFVLTDWDRSLMSLALGIFIGGRIAATGR